MLSGRLLCRWVITPTSEMKDPVLDHMWKEAEGANYLSFWAENTSHVMIWYLSSRLAVLPAKTERSTVTRWSSRSPSSGWRTNRPQWSCICQVRNICQITIVAPLKSRVCKVPWRTKQKQGATNTQAKQLSDRTTTHNTNEKNRSNKRRLIFIYISFVCITRC